MLPPPPPSPAAAAAAKVDHNAASSNHATWPAFLQQQRNKSSSSRRPAHLIGHMPITDLDFDLAACPTVGRECRLCYSDINSLVSKGFTYFWQQAHINQVWCLAAR
jgi:hypothetical protein